MFSASYFKSSSLCMEIIIQERLNQNIKIICLVQLIRKIKTLNQRHSSNEFDKTFMPIQLLKAIFLIVYI